MSGDYKWDMQMIAEEMAREKFGKDFHELSDADQYALYNAATIEYVERMCDRADYMRKAERENAR